MIHDKNNKIEENSKNNNGQIESKNKNNDPKINSPIINKTKNFINISQQNNINTIIIKKKAINKKQNNNKSQLNTEMIKSPERLVANKKAMNSTTMINSFIGKNKSLENENLKKIKK